MRFRFFIVACFALLSFHASAQLITVKSEFSSDSVMIGEPFNFSISVQSAPDVNVTFPVYSDTITKALEIVKTSDIDTQYLDNVRILNQEYLLTSFEPGWNTLAPQALSFQKGDLSDTVYTTALLLTVLAPEIDTTQAIKPIKPPVYTPVSFQEVFPWILIIIGSALVVLLIVFLIRKYILKKELPELFTQKNLEPAHVIAFRELEKLKTEKLPQSGRVKEYYTRLTEIVRVYITRQYNIHAMESTTSEILDAFRTENKDEKGLIESLENLLMLADLVKFAKEDPLLEENERHLANAVSFVEKTYRMFETEAEPKKDSPAPEKIQAVQKNESENIDSKEKNRKEEGDE